LKNTGIYSKPNAIDFQTYSKDKSIQKDSLDKFIEQKRVVEDYTPYKEDFGYFTVDTETDFETKNINNDIDYNIKDQKQITISLDFSTDAYLANTAIAYNDIDDSLPITDNIHYTSQINFLNSNKKAVSSNSFPTAYWNFVDNRWEYLDSKSINISSDGFVSNSGDEDVIFPANIYDKNIIDGDYSFLDNVKNNLLNRPICFSPSFRPNLETNNANISSNKSFLMQPTTSHGFPQKNNWQPHENHVLKMSDYIDENFIAEKIIIKGKISANFEKPLKNGNFGVSTDFSNFSEDYALKQLENSYTASIDTLGFTFFILNQRKNADVINKSQIIPSGSFYVDAVSSFWGDAAGLTLTSNNLYAENSFVNNNSIASKVTGGAIYEFENKNLDFYTVDSTNTNDLYTKNKTNMFYYLDKTESLASTNNRHTQFIVRDVDSWSESNYNDDLMQTNDSSNMNIFNITDCYSSGVNQIDASRELVTFSNLLLVNTNDADYTNDSMFKNVDNVISIQNSDNSIANQDFIINANFKNYNESSHIDETKYALLSNKTNEGSIITTGSKSFFEFTLSFGYEIFHDSFNNFKSALDNKYFRFKTADSNWLEFRFKDTVLNNNFLYIDDHDGDSIDGNYINLNELSNDNEWSSDQSISTVIRAAKNFDVFVERIFDYVFNTSLLNTLSFYDGTTCDTTIGDIKLVTYFNMINEYDKLIKIKFESKDNDTDISSLGEEHSFTNNVTFSIVSNYSNVSTTYETETLENNISILEGLSKGSENFLGVSAERLIRKSRLDSDYIPPYENSVKYSFHNSNTVNSVIKTEYLIKPSDEFIFGINSYGNGDLISSILELHDNLDITIIGRTQEKENKSKTNESSAIRKVLKSAKERKTNIEGAYLTNKNYFSNMFSSKVFNGNKKVTGSSSSNKFGTWGGFVNFEEVEASSTKNKSYRKFYYDSVLPNFVDIFSGLSGKTPVETNEDIITFIIDDNYLSTITTMGDNKENILFKDEWLQNFLFNNVNNFDSFRNISNTINGSINNYFVNELRPATKIDINVNQDSFLLNSASTNDITIGNYTLPYYAGSPSINRLPAKIYNNDLYDFIKSNKNISIDDTSNLLDEYQVAFSIQKPKGFDKWILVVHDNSEILKNSDYPVYEKFKSYIEQSNNDFTQKTFMDPSDQEVVQKAHLLSTRSIPLTLYTPLSIAAGIPPVVTPFRSFTKRFKVFYKSNNTVYDLDSIDTNDYVDTRKFFTELEYWEASELQRSFDDAIERPTNMGGADSGVPYNEVVYTENGGFINSNLKVVADLADTTYASIDHTAGVWDTIYNFGDEIGSTGIYVTSLSDAPQSLCMLSVPRYKLLNTELYDYPVLENPLKDEYRFNENESIINTIQTYINKNYLEDNVEKLTNVDSEFDKRNTLNPDLLLNEKIYAADVYYIIESNMTKTNIQAVFKYNKDENGLLFPYIELLSMKSKSSLFNTKFNKKDSSIFLPETGKIRIYEQNLLDIHNDTNLLKLDNVPYFEIDLYGIDFNNTKIDTTGVTTINKGSKIFSIKKENAQINTTKLNRRLLPLSTINNPENHEEWDSFEDRDRNINNFIYTFGKNHNSLPLEKCGGFKFGVLNGHKTSPTYKFNAYNYGHFADFIAYSTNTAYIRKEPSTGSQIIEYATEKVFVDSYYNVVSTSANTYNKDVYSRCSYPYIEDASNELSQLHVQ
jgi:hypothetical protein